MGLLTLVLVSLEDCMHYHIVGAVPRQHYQKTFLDSSPKILRYTAQIQKFEMRHVMQRIVLSFEKSLLANTFPNLAQLFSRFSWETK